MKEFFTNPGVIAGLAYLIVLPIIVWGIARTQKALMIDRVKKKTKRREDLNNLPEPVWGIWKERLSFTIKDKRSLSIKDKPVNLERRILLIILYLSGLIITVGLAFLGQYKLMVVGYILFFISVIFGIKSSKSLLKERERIMKRMLEVANSKLGGSSKDINEVVRVLDWQDFVTPQKIEFTVPTTFSSIGQDGFLQQFNQVFGNLQEWVPSEEDGGWDYDKGIATFYAVPPLPQKADWLEHYAIADGIDDGFFPIGLSVQGGISLPNPETGEIENVLGFDVAGTQIGAAKKAGLTMHESISASPQSLVAGATGGGKSLSALTKIAVYEEL